MMEKIRWGVLGTANIARGCAIPGMKQAKNCEPYAVAGRSLDKAKAFAGEGGFQKAYGSYEELLEDDAVQAVYVPLPNSLHCRWVEAALRAKKHVLCEKPLALNADEARRMFALARENGVLLMEAYAYLHSPYVASLQADIADGIIGEVDFVDTAFVTQGYKEDIRLYKELGGGAMYDLGCYCTTMILSLIGSEVRSVRASAEFSKLGVDLASTGTIRFVNGAWASFNVGMILGPDTNARFDRLYVHGTKGCIKSDVEFNQEGELCYRIFTAAGVTERKLVAPQNYALEIEDLGNAILSGTPLRVSPEFSIKNAELMDRVFAEIGY